MFNYNRKSSPIVDITVDGDSLKIEVEFFTEKQFTFYDEFDIITLEKINKSDGLSPSQIILTGLFRELMELGHTVSYEDELYLKEEVENFCKTIFE